MSETIGSTTDMVTRIKSVLPTKWFADSSPNLDALLTGLGSVWSGLYELLQFVRLQARITTASGIFLDIAAHDYCGTQLVRRAGETDAAFSRRIRTNLLTPRATRFALDTALFQLTGRAAQIFEPANSEDTGGYNTNRLGYNLIGGYGSMVLPYQIFVTAYRPNSTSTISASGYNTGPGAYNTAPLSYNESNEEGKLVSDDEIYKIIRSVIPVNLIAWTQVVS